MTISQEAKNIITPSVETKNTAVVGEQSEPGSSWQYNKYPLAYNQNVDELSGHLVYYNSIGLLSDYQWTNETKHIV